MERRAWLVVAMLVLGCGGGNGGNGGGSAGGGGTSSATSLDCNTKPAALPFKLKSSGWQSPANASLVMQEPRNKDEADQTLGVANGVSAHVFGSALVQPPLVAAFDGLQLRTTVDGGLTGDPLPGEYVSLWRYDSAMAAWATLGRTMTDSAGHYDFGDTGFVPALAEPVYAVLEADGSCATHYAYLQPAGTKLVVFDIDGTLTTSDSEVVKQLTMADYTPAMKMAADKLVHAWSDKGYSVVYLTARIHLFRQETAEWLDQLGFPRGAVITADSAADPAGYKTMWLQHLIQDFGWQVVAAYGNAATDITAYANAGIATSATFIIGEDVALDARGGTVAIENDDYTAHIASYVDLQPDNK